jgi:hypothetical protein
MRLTVLRALENPDSLVGAVDAAVLNEMRELSRAYQAAPIELVQCLAVKSREEANYWIELRHTGENQGAGIVDWGADETARFRARSGQLEIHSQALNFLELHGHLTPAKRAQVPVSSFKRLLGTPEVRAKVGIDLQNGKFFIWQTQNTLPRRFCTSLTISHLPSRGRNIFIHASSELTTRINCPPKLW